MTVKELIEQLSKIKNQDVPVMVDIDVPSTDPLYGNITCVRAIAGLDNPSRWDESISLIHSEE